MHVVDYSFALAAAALLCHGGTASASPLGTPPRRPPMGLTPLQVQNWNIHCSRHLCNWETIKDMDHIMTSLTTQSKEDIEKLYPEIFEASGAQAMRHAAANAMPEVAALLKDPMVPELGPIIPPKSDVNASSVEKPIQEEETDTARPAIPGRFSYINKTDTSRIPKFLKMALGKLVPSALKETRDNIEIHRLEVHPSELESGNVYQNSSADARGKNRIEIHRLALNDGKTESSDNQQKSSTENSRSIMQKRSGMLLKHEISDVASPSDYAPREKSVNVNDTQPAHEASDSEWLLPVPAFTESDHERHSLHKRQRRYIEDFEVEYPHDVDEYVVLHEDADEELVDEDYVSETETYMVEYVSVDEEEHVEEDTGSGGIVSAVPFGYIREDDYIRVAETPIQVIEIEPLNEVEVEPILVAEKQQTSKKKTHKKITSAPIKLPFPVTPDGECKGNCPLKHNLLPKYTPDDGGQLKCPEHDGRKFRSKQGAVFEVACYADYGGRNMKVETETSLDACINTCTGVTQCKAVVFVPGELDGACYLKFNQGKSHMNPFVMGARMAATDCGPSNDCERHNKVWNMEQEDARRERQRTQIEETRTHIDQLRKERATLERERHNQRMQRIKEHIAKESQERAAEADRARYEQYAKQEEAYARQKHHETVEKQRDQQADERRFKWKLATEERERERLRHQVEKEREALHGELDKTAHGEWADDEEWWRESRFKTHPAKEIKPHAKPVKDDGTHTDAEEFENMGEYPTDDEWRWYPDPSRVGYWDAESLERETFEGWVTEDEYGLQPRDDWDELVIDGSALRRDMQAGLIKRRDDTPAAASTAIPIPSTPVTQKAPRPAKTRPPVLPKPLKPEEAPLKKPAKAEEAAMNKLTEPEEAAVKQPTPENDPDANELPIIESNVDERKRLNGTHQLVLGEDITLDPDTPTKTYYFTYSDEDVNLGFLNFAKIGNQSFGDFPFPSNTWKHQHQKRNADSGAYTVTPRTQYELSQLDISLEKLMQNDSGATPDVRANAFEEFLDEQSAYVNSAECTFSDETKALVNSVRNDVKAFASGPEREAIINSLMDGLVRSWSAAQQPWYVQLGILQSEPGVDKMADEPPAAHSRFW